MTPKSTALLGAAALFCATAAHASIIPTLEAVTDNGDGTWTFGYEATLAGDAGLTVGSRLVIFDFAGYVPGSIFAGNPNIGVSTELTPPAC